MGNRVGIDIGGTFTDFFVLRGTGEVRTFKVPTVPADPVRGVMAGLEGVARSYGTDVETFLTETDHIVHGTTVATNAVLTGSGVRTGLITTRGFRDALEMRRGHRERVFANVDPPPVPLVPRALRIGVTGRIDKAGEVLIPLDLDDAREAFRHFTREGVHAVAVSLLFSFLNPAHERAIGRLAAEEFPHLHVALSCDALPEIGEYERTSTVVVDAYVGPIIDAYTRRLEEALQKGRFGGTLLFMQSNGGVESVEMARQRPVTLVLSGPAGGPSAAAHYCATHDIDNVITVDMGGTSFDACLIRGRMPSLTFDADLAGHRVAVPMVDVHVIGAGGGSVAWIDAGGLLRVGPRSAGAVPGPACYGQGGVEPTVTDADLVLGWLNPDFFLGGRVKLDPDAARRAIEGRVARELRLDPAEAALGIVRVVTASMADGVSKISVRRGYDPREFCLLVGGGAGPTHAAAIARELELTRVLVPGNASVLCAFGMLASPPRHCFVRTHIFPVAELATSRAPALWDDLRREALAVLGREGVEAAAVILGYTADMRYAGQVHQVEVELDGAEVAARDAARIAARFHRAHEALYGYADAHTEVECVNLRMSATTVPARMAFPARPFAGEDPSPAGKGARRALFDAARGFVETAVFDAGRLACGNVIDGPAIIEETDTTIVVLPGYRAVCDQWGNYHLSPASGAVAAP